MIRKSIQIVALAGVLASGGWLWKAPGPEPFVALLAAMGTLLGALATEKTTFSAFHLRYLRHSIIRLRERVLQSLLGKRYRRWHQEATLEFFWPSAGNVGRHEIVATRLWHKDIPSELVSLCHYSPTMDPYDFFVFSGHTIQLISEDFDGDRKPEVAVTYHCGGHSMGFRLFRFSEYGILSPVVGSDIASDSPEVSWRDEDGDGRLEIYVRQTNWSNREAGFLCERYVFNGNSYVKDANYSEAAKPRDDKSQL